MDANYAAQVGERLRNIRLQKGLSLHDVEASSEKEFKASVLGAYERGERSISVPRLQRLAHFYGVPVDQLLPKSDERETGVTGEIADRIRIDLNRLRALDAPERPILERYLNFVQVQRGDFNGRILTIRSEDLKAIASVLDLSPESLSSTMDSLGIKAPSLN